jgi:hypothetical protein
VACCGALLHMDVQVPMGVRPHTVPVQSQGCKCLHGELIQTGPYMISLSALPLLYPTVSLQSYMYMIKACNAEQLQSAPATLA